MPNQTALVLLLILAFTAAITLLGVVTSWLDANVGIWRRLSRAYPPRPVEEPHDAGEARVIIVKPERRKRLGAPIGAHLGTWVGAGWPMRGFLGCLLFPLFPFVIFWQALNGLGITNVRYRVDVEHLHLDLPGALGPSKPVSIPWTAIAQTGPMNTWLGEAYELEVPEAVLAVPRFMIERELRTQAAVRMAEDGELPEDDAPEDTRQVRPF